MDLTVSDLRRKELKPILPEHIPGDDKGQAAELVLAYMTNVATLYQVPMLELLERLKVKTLCEWGNG